MKTNYIKDSYNLAFNGEWNTGAEIGAYTDNKSDDSIIEKAGFKLNTHGTELIDRYVEGQYWINGFVPQEKISGVWKRPQSVPDKKCSNLCKFQFKTVHCARKKTVLALITC